MNALDASLNLYEVNPTDFSYDGHELADGREQKGDNWATPHRRAQTTRQEAMRTLKGLTIIEALVAVAVFGILLSVAAPSFSQLLHAQQLDSATQIMRRSLAMARHEAIKRGKPLTLAVREGEWSNGWFLFQDGNDNGRYDPDDLLLRAFPPVPSSTRLTGNTHVSSYIRYTPNGRATLLNGGYQMGTLKVCLKAQARGNTLVINNGGRVRYSRGADACHRKK